MDDPSKEAAWSNVDRSAPLRSVQCCSLLRTPLRRLAPTIESAVTTAESHSAADVSGDHPTRST